MIARQKNKTAFLRAACAALFACGIIISFGFTNINKQYDSPTAPPESVEEQKPTYKMVDKMPEFPGGQEALLKWIENTVGYPKKALVNGIEGRVLARFVVDENGNVCEAEILQSPHKLLSDEVLLALSRSPKWKPGSQNGRAVRVYYIMPVNFNAKRYKAMQNYKVM